MTMYELVKREPIKDIGEAFIYNHKKTNAKVVHIKNNDKNKVFSILFRTPPKDNTGVFHILEHCVLAGSEKYPLKEPFNQLDKCTINTYLNAITYADKTIYPVASTNDKDFFKLVDVYLDGVFNPLIKSKQGIFLQEGWYFNNNEINGIVYNEMQGAYSTPDVLLDFEVKKNLFKDSVYGYDSGGYPDNIIDLTYDNFLRTYDEYYTPSNSIIYLYGDLDISYYLNYIDTEYLSNFSIFENSCNKGLCQIEKSKSRTTPLYKNASYYTDDLSEQKNYIQATFKLKFSCDESKNIAFDILADILTENQDGILKKALVDAGVCEDVTSYIDDDMIEPIFTILVEETCETTVINFKNILFETIENIVIEDNLIKSAIATNEFFFQEKDFGYKPKGLFYGVTLFKHIIYEKYDFDCLKFDELIEELRHFDYKNLLVDNILNNNDAIFCILKPTDTQISKKPSNTKNIEALFEYQSEVDTQVNLDKIPPLPISDINPDIFKINSKEQFVKNRPLIYNVINSDISYYDMIFDISSISKYYSRYVSIFVFMLGKLDTKKYKSSELEQAITLLIGGASMSNSTISIHENKFFPTFQFSARILNKNIEKAFDVLNELFLNTIFDDKNKIKRLLLEFLHKTKLEATYEPKDYSIRIAKSYISSQFSYLDDVEGLNFYYWLKNLCDNIDSTIDDIILKMIFIQKNIFNIQNVYFAVSSNENIFNTILELTENFEFLQNFENYDKIQNKDTNFIYTVNKNYNEAFYTSTSTNVNFNTQVASIYEKFSRSGSLDVLNQMLNSSYLWEKIRTEGGAYGSTISIDLDGLICLNSYHDPNIKKTYEHFKNIPRYISNLDISEKEVHLYKIGAINKLDKPPKNCDINEMALMRYFKKITHDEIYKNKVQVLETTLSDIKSNFDYFSECLSNAKICTVGSKNDILRNKNLFYEVNKFL